MSIVSLLSSPSLASQWWWMFIISSRKEKTQFNCGINIKQSLEVASARGVPVFTKDGPGSFCESLAISLKVLRDGAAHDIVLLFMVERQAWEGTSGISLLQEQLTPKSPADCLYSTASVNSQGHSSKGVSPGNQGKGNGHSIAGFLMVTLDKVPQPLKWSQERKGQSSRKWLLREQPAKLATH